MEQFEKTLARKILINVFRFSYRKAKQMGNVKLLKRTNKIAPDVGE